MNDVNYEDSVLSMLPARVSAAIYEARDTYKCRINEIRIRAGHRISITADGDNIPVECICNKDELSDIVFELCGKSVYAHSTTINDGYIILSGGIRAGVCGKAVCNGDVINAVHDFTSVNIRIPHRYREAGKFMRDVFCKMKCVRGILVYSLPGCGKTTALREFCSVSVGKRIALVDTRGEMGFAAQNNELCDIMSGYPRASGIQIAIRTMNPQVIVCDEMCTEEDVLGMIACLRSGVPLVASIHGDSYESVMSSGVVNKDHIKRLFGAYVGIRRNENGKFLYEVNYTNECMA